ncbi:MAG TPA: hypothetical protein VGO96_18585 [Pyrinomonadaceae bacterium]|jgi:hypothetical protein|nr:hypothetical protein [Pyrinomonadaceae bacterium]
MKTNLFLLCAVVLLINTSGSAQKADRRRVPAQTVTLVSHTKQKSYEKSIFNFEYGVRGDKKFPRQMSLDEMPDVRSVVDLNRQQSDLEVSNVGRMDITIPGVQRVEVPSNRPTRYDIRYGGFSLNGDDNWLDIVNRRGSRSMLKDLGEMSWSEVEHVPVLPASPTPHTGEVTHSFSRGVIKSTPEEVLVKAIAGHVYVMHVKDRRTDYYVMFRVEAIEPQGECTLSWKRVPSPER